MYLYIHAVCEFSCTLVIFLSSKHTLVSSASVIRVTEKYNSAKLNVYESINTLYQARNFNKAVDQFGYRIEEGMDRKMTVILEQYRPL